MSEKTAISWTESTWNPIRSTTGRHYCERISAGCDHCYAATMTRRLARHDYPRVSDAGEPGLKIPGVSPLLDLDALAEPLRWRTPRKIFACSMTDIAGEWVPQEWLNSIFTIMWRTPQHTYQVLTKRPNRLKQMVDRHYQSIQRGPLPNVWLGVSVEDDRFAWRAKTLAEIPAVIRFVSAEPLLGPLPNLDVASLDWLIAGSESGHGYRPMDDDWVRDLRDRAQAAGTAFFFKQRTVNGRKVEYPELDGRVWSEFPGVPA